MRVAILWTRLSGYFNACLRDLGQHSELFVASQSAHSEAPFTDSQFDWVSRHYSWDEQPDSDALDQDLRSFKPDIILSSSWNVKGYWPILRHQNGKSFRVICMDNNWLGTPKQYVGILTAPMFIQKLGDAAWVAGERQALFAHRLGFSQARILRGVYSCDHDSFAAAHRARTKSVWAQNFLFTGRFVKEKGISTLVEAYRLYRQASVTTPWTLRCCGAGPLKSLLENQPGIILEGFVQPAELPDKFLASGAFVMPSIFEPWGVALHEAAAAGLPLIASEAVGSTPHLLQYGYNGYICEPSDPAHLAKLMLTIANAPESALRQMGEGSYNLSLQFTPRLWTRRLLDAWRMNSSECTAAVS